jgi:hypothetical protein
MTTSDTRKIVEGEVSTPVPLDCKAVPVEDHDGAAFSTPVVGFYKSTYLTQSTVPSSYRLGRYRNGEYVLQGGFVWQSTDATGIEWRDLETLSLSTTSAPGQTGYDTVLCVIAPCPAVPASTSECPGNAEQAESSSLCPGAASPASSSKPVWMTVEYMLDNETVRPLDKVFKLAMEMGCHAVKIRFARCITELETRQNADEGLDATGEPLDGFPHLGPPRE